jgi:putative ABC transport system permease protein
VAFGAAVTFAALGGAGWLMVRALQRFRGAAGVAWRFGLANVARRGRESIVQVVAFGLGIMVLLVLSLVRQDLMNAWRASLPENAPNRFMINIQPHEEDPIRAFLAERGIDSPPFVPMVRARLTYLNVEDITQLSFEDPQGVRWARREANLSFSDEMQADNQIVSGAWWSPDDAEPQVSVEQDFGNELGLELGDRLQFDIAGEELEVTVSSFRTVEWDSFRPNFFMVLNPPALQDHPGTWIKSVYLREGQQAATIDLMRSFPSVTVIDLDAALGQVRDVMDKAALAVQAVFAFTLLAGLAVLWAAVQSTRDERRFEAALLRSMGASRRRVLGGVVTEFLAIGLLAGLLATAGATLAGWLLATRLYELDYQFNAALTVAGPLLGMLFVGLAGWFATRRVVLASPMNVLRAA